MVRLTAPTPHLGWDRLPPSAGARLDAAATHLLTGANELDAFVTGHRPSPAAVEQELTHTQAVLRTLIAELHHERRDGPDDGDLAAVAFATTEFAVSLKRLEWAWSLAPTLRAAPLAVRDLARAVAAVLRAVDGKDVDARLRDLDERREETRPELRRARAELLTGADRRLVLAGGGILRRAEDAAAAGEAVRRAILRLAVR